MTLLLPIVSTAVGFLGNLFGASKSSEANNRAYDALKKRRTDLDAAYNHDYNKDFMDTTESKSAIRSYQDSMGKIKAGLNNTAVKTGATPESVVATGARMNDSYAGFLNKLAGNSTRYKQAIKDRYNQRKDAVDGQELSFLAKKGEDWNNFGSNVSNAAGNVMSAWAMGGFDGSGTDKKDWFKGMGDASKTSSNSGH